MPASPGMRAAVSPAARWLLFAVISAIYFMISAATFSSLGIVLPYMIKELSWTWSQAGIGFSLLALMVGLASALPAWTIRRFGIAATYGFGGVIMVVGFALLALSSGIYSYLVAAALLGLGFALCAVVPAVYLLNGWMPHKRSTFIGAYMTIGGLGAVAGPLAANGFMVATHAWRLYWWAMAAVMLVLTLLALVFVRSPPREPDAGQALDAGANPQAADRPHRYPRDWRFRDAVRTPQYWVISLSMTATLLCVLTTSSCAPAHMGALGVSAGVAAGVLSTNGAVGALSRYLGAPLDGVLRATWAARSPRGSIRSGCWWRDSRERASAWRHSRWPTIDSHSASSRSPKDSASACACWPARCCWSTTSGLPKIPRSTVPSI